jgi:hypothetical protein
MKRLTFLLLIVFLLGCSSQIKNCKETCKRSNSEEFCERICEKEIFDPRWKFLDFDRLGSAWFYDPKSIVVSGNIVKVWGKQIFSERGKQNYIKRRIQRELNVKGYENLDRALHLLKIDCSEKEYKILERIDYSDSSVLYYADIPEFLAEWHSILPNSLIERLFEEVCKTKNKK